MAILALLDMILAVGNKLFCIIRENAVSRHQNLISAKGCDLDESIGAKLCVDIY